MSAELNAADKIRDLANEFAERLKQRVDERVQEMEDDDTSHYLIYQVLGIGSEEGRLIDIYQSKGRFLYNYAGRFLEAAAKICFLDRYPDSGSIWIPKTQG